MASSSVRENVFLTVTPTLGGVYRKLLYIIFEFFILGQICMKKNSNIIYNNFLYTPPKVGVTVRKTFSLTLDEAMPVGLAKACALRKKLFCYTENSVAIE